MKPLSKETKGMNKTEARYAQELDVAKKAGYIKDYKFEGVKFKLADNTFYTPDFFVIYPGFFMVVEIKGFLREDAAVKFKVAAAQYPWFEWRMIRWKNKQWEVIYDR